MTEKNYSLKSQARYLFAGRVAAFIIRFIIPILLVRLFTKEEYGLYRQVMLIAFFFIPLLRFGMANSLLYFYPTAKEKIKELMSQTFYFIFFIGLIFLPFFFLLKNPIVHFFKGDAIESLIYPCGLYVFFFLISFILEYVLILEQKSQFVFLYILIDQIIRVICVVFAALFYETVEALIWSLVIYGIARSVFLYIYLVKNYDIKMNIFRGDKKYFFSQIRYAFPLGMGQVLKQIGSKVDQFILSALLSSASFAVYSVANFVSPALNLVYTSVGEVTFPHISRNRSLGQHNEVKRLWHKMIETYASITIPVLVFSFVMANPIITFLYTEQYIDSVTIFRIFVSILLLKMLSHGTIVRAYGFTDFVFLANLLSMISGIVLGYILIKNFGIIGGSISVVISFAINSLMQVYKAKKILSLRWNEWLPWKKIFTMMIYALVFSVFLIGLLQVDMDKFFKIALAGIVYFPAIGLIYLKKHLIELKDLPFMEKIIGKKLAFIVED